jgi:hypothetical protein
MASISASPAPVSGSDVRPEIFNESAVMEYFKQKQRDWTEGFQYPEEGGSFNGDEGPVVLAEGKKAVIDLGVGLNHGNGGGQSVTGVSGGSKQLVYRYRDKKLELTGPLTAFCVLQKLALAVRHEVARNYLLSSMARDDGSEDFDEEDYGSDEEQAPYKLPVFPPDQLAKYALTILGYSAAAVLDVEPDPTHNLSQRDLQKLYSDWEQMGSGGGVTAFWGFKKHDREPDVWVLQWSDPFC